MSFPSANMRRHKNSFECSPSAVKHSLRAENRNCNVPGTKTVRVFRWPCLSDGLGYEWFWYITIWGPFIGTHMPRTQDHIDLLLRRPCTNHWFMMTSSNGNISARYWPFVRGIHRLPVNSPHKSQWRGALRFSLICTGTNVVQTFETPSRSLWRHSNVMELLSKSMSSYSLCVVLSSSSPKESATRLLQWHHIRPDSQIPQCTCPISRNAPFRTEICTFLFWMVHCRTWGRFIVGFLRLVCQSVSYHWQRGLLTSCSC